MITTVDEQSKGAGTSQNTASYAIYAVALAVSISIWFFAIRAPLWLDETSGYWWVKDTFSLIWSRQTLDPPAYYYILWLSTKILGTSEMALRTPSILAMLGAVYLLYRAARELFDRDVALIAAVIFCLHPVVIFESVDVRPYAFGALATNAAILILLRLRHNDSNALAVLFGIAAAFTLYFHYLFGVILPALLLCFFIVKRGRGGRVIWRQLAIAVGTFAVTLPPLIPGLRFLFGTGGTHVFEAAPKLGDLLYTLASGWLGFLFAGACIVALIVAAVTKEKSAATEPIQGWKVAVCASLGLIPILILYGVSVGTSLHMFVDRHRLVAVPGIALCWAYAVGRFRPAIRLLLCVVLVAFSTWFYLRAPIRGRHFDSWKYALQFAERNASTDNAPVVICSDFPESDYVAMPTNSAKSSRFFSQLSYYKLSVPVVPMPRSLNAEAIRVGSQFLQEATQKHERFLALAYTPSYKTLDWLAQKASERFDVRKLGVFDRVEVLEFDPKAQDGGVR